MEPDAYINGLVWAGVDVPPGALLAYARKLLGFPRRDSRVGGLLGSPVLLLARAVLLLGRAVLLLGRAALLLCSAVSLLGRAV